MTESVPVGELRGERSSGGGAQADAVSAAGIAVTDPVFVLCSARSGSTLLRFLLDGHPDLACPPEMNLPALCAQLASVWSLVEGAPLSPERGEEPPVIPDAAVSGIRYTLDLMLGSYLARRGKRRYCDKSLGTARFAELLLRLYPEAKFVCLYRHPMDVIASGMEACPWGLTGYGFDPYIGASPGNMVLALARYWADAAAAAAAIEERFPESCHRVRYEDLVAAPEGVAQDVFRFLRAAPAPGISDSCFTAERERIGPADYKIWHTSGITAGSVGRGWRIPAGQIPAQVLEQVNTLADELGYLPVGPEWGSGAPPGDVRADARDAWAGAPGVEELGVGSSLGLASAAVEDRLRAGLTRLGDGFAHRWGGQAVRPFGVVVTGRTRADGQLRWRVDPAARTLVTVAARDDDATEWDILGPAAAWQQVISGDINLGVALRRQDLRYCDADEAGAVATEIRIDMLGDFLGLARWPDEAGPERGPRGTRERVYA